MELDEAESTVRQENYLPDSLWIDFESRLVNLTISVCNYIWSWDFDTRLHICERWPTLNWNDRLINLDIRGISALAMGG